MWVAGTWARRTWYGQGAGAGTHELSLFYLLVSIQRHKKWERTYIDLERNIWTLELKPGGEWNGALCNQIVPDMYVAHNRLVKIRSETKNFRNQKSKTRI